MLGLYRINGLPSIWASAAFTLINSAFLLTMMSLGDVQLTIELVLFCTFVCAVLVKSGELSLQVVSLTNSKAWLPMSFVVGFAVISVLMVVLTFIVNISALAAFWISTLAFLILGYYASRGTTSSLSREWTDPSIALVFVVLIGLLAMIPVSSPRILLDLGMLPIWSDYFLHGKTIASFGSSFSFGDDMELVGVNRIFYHYAPFMISAAFQPLSGMSGLALSTSLLLPLGLLIAAYGSYVLAVDLGGRPSGLFALIVIICIPAFSSFIQSGWFDFYWLLLISPGSCYAVGVAAVVCVSTAAYLKKNDRSVLWFTLLLLLSLILIRVHMFVLLTPVILGLILLNRWHLKIRFVLGIVIVAIMTVTLALNFSTDLHSLWIEHSKPYDYLDMVLQWSSIYGQQINLSGYPPGLTMLMQTLLVLAAILGAYFVAYPLLLGLNVRRFGYHAIDMIPVLLILNFIFLMLFAPAFYNGDYTEFKHRHFLLLYVVVAIYTVTYAFALLPKYMHAEKRFTQWLSGITISIVAVSIFLNWDLNPARPNIEVMPWASSYHNQSITPGLLEASQYIGIHARPGDVLAMGGDSMASNPKAHIISLVSLTGIPAFVARSDQKMVRSQCIQEIVTQRLGILQRLSSMDDWSEAQRFLQSNGIRWFVVSSGKGPQWDPELKSPVFSTNGILVYDAGDDARELFIKPQC